MVQPGWKLMYPLCCCSCCTSAPGTENGVGVTSPLHSQSADPSLMSAYFTDSWAAASSLPSGVPLGRPTDSKHLFRAANYRNGLQLSHSLGHSSLYSDCCHFYLDSLLYQIQQLVNHCAWLPEGDSSVALFSGIPFPFSGIQGFFVLFFPQL